MKIRRHLLAATLMACACVPAAYADNASEPENVLVYQLAYFADARPNTAYDMIQRLPAFTFGDGNTERGFAGTAGNVVIDGQRPTSKSDDLQSVLNRIPASNVERIEVIRGGAQGIDMQGQTVIANVILKKADSTQIIAQADTNFWLDDHHSVPDLSVQYTQHTGDNIFEASLKRFGNFDDSVGRGTYSTLDVPTGAFQEVGAHSTGRGAGTSFTGAATVPMFDGQFKANLLLQDSPFHSTLSYYFPTGTQRIGDDTSSHTGELGLHWNGNVGSSQLETLVLQRLERDTDHNALSSPALTQDFRSRNNTGETIARATLRHPVGTTMTLEGGLEGAYNFLDGISSYAENGVAVPLPSANARVEEKRGEAFAQGTWKFDPDWLLEAGARFEYSKISETGGTDQSRYFFYPKPRAVLTWSVDKKTQLRLRYERVVGQLDFGNFIATSSLGGNGLQGGNPNLKPDQHTQYEFSYERHFWDKGALVVSLMHDQIKDVVDNVPVTSAAGTFDAPGNIGNGKLDQLDVELTLPLDWLGLENGLLKSTNIFRRTRVKDPVTGKERFISPGLSGNQSVRPQDVEFTLTQDIPSLKSTWEIDYFNGWDEHYYQIEQVRHRRIPPALVSVAWIYKPTSEWSLRLELDNMARFEYENTFYDYAGPRDIAPLTEIDERRIKSQPRLYVEIRKTFG
ncbi:MAG: TonB-dependent receptor [Proteobacteria bacterium]|nr:TonB-dependent receptor [Pseudomonadota bacterium]